MSDAIIALPQLINRYADGHQGKFAQLVGISQSALSAYLTGRRRPSYRTLRAIERRLGVRAIVDVTNDRLTFDTTPPSFTQKAS